MQAVRFHEHGGPEVVRVEDLPLPEPGEGEVRIGVRFAGVNFIDVYRRTGFYPVPGGLPAIPGAEASGVVEALVHRAERLLPLPDGVGFEAGAALPLQGMTAHYLTHDPSAIGG